MNTFLKIFIFFLLLGFETAYAGNRNFINQSNQIVQISLNGLACKDYPPQFKNCVIEEKNKVVIILDPKESVLVAFNHYLIGHLEIQDLTHHLLFDKQTLVDKKGDPIFSPLNYCFAIILKNDSKEKLSYQFEDCMKNE